jgi:hypothetical protein
MTPKIRASHEKVLNISLSRIYDAPASFEYGKAAFNAFAIPCGALSEK